MEQLTLWDDEQPPVVPPGSIQIPDIGGTLEREKGWAEGSQMLSSLCSSFAWVSQ